MAHAAFLTLRCLAKVNLALSVASPLDSGMHPIASWMVAVDFADTLTLHRLEVGPSRFSVVFSPLAPRVEEVNWPLEKDLAFRAHALLEKHAGRPLPVRAAVEKMIPTGAGLGGGSSDAAAMLVGLNDLFELGVSTDGLCSLASELGSDVVFLTAALAGQPSTLVTGLGETLSPLPLVEPVHMVLVFPHAACPTGAVYKAFDATLAGKNKSAEEERVRELAKKPVKPDGPFNDLASAACVVQPALKEAILAVGDAAGQVVHITGSGAALFVIAANEADANAMAVRITQETSLPTRVTRTV